MTIPTSLLVPGTYVEIDNSRAVEGSLVGPATTVLFGQMTSDGSATSGTYEQILTRESAIEKYGKGSLLAQCFDTWFKGNLGSDVYAVALPDAVGAGKASSTITVTGNATANGTLALYLNGEQVQVGVLSGETPTDVGDSIEEAFGTLTTDADYPMTAAAVSGVVTLTAKNGGTVGNQITVRQNQVSTDSTPAGLSVDISTVSGGATDVDVDDFIAAIPDDIINWIISPYNDVTSIGKISDELERRWTELVQLDGHAVISYGGNAAEAVAFADALNDEHLTIVDSGKDSATPEYLWATAFTAPVAYSAVDGGVTQPFKSLTIGNVYGDTETNKRKFTERQALLAAGVTTHLIERDGNVIIERSVTTYKENPLGSPDISMRNLNTLVTSSYVRQSVINMINTKFSRHKLSDDTGPAVPAGQKVVTPNVMKGELIQLYETWQNLFICTNLPFFKETLSVTINPSDPTRLDIFMRPVYISQFYVASVQLQYRLL